MDLDPKVTRWARILQVIVTVVMAAIPVVIVASFALGTLGVADMRETYADQTLPTVLAAWQIAGVYAIEAVQVGILLFVLWHVRALFGLYAQAEVLSARCAERIVIAAQGLLVMGVAGAVGYTVNVLILTMLNAPGQRAISVALSDTELGFWLAGGLLLVIGWVMRHAAQVHEENRGFI